MHPHYAVRKKRPRAQRKPSTDIKMIDSLQSFRALVLQSIHRHTMSIVAFQHQVLQPCSLAILNIRPEGVRENAVPCVTQHYAAIHSDAVLMHLMLLYMQALIVIANR